MFSLIPQVLSSWMVKFDAIYRGEEDCRRSNNRLPSSAASELILSKEQLYDMFQNILGIKKVEHQLLYNACQVIINPLEFSNCCAFLPDHDLPLPNSEIIILSLFCFSLIMLMNKLQL